jgi:phosphatidylserine/phosphatidylglycerophosphate/cardiolipin synthase-like enzyme
MPDVRDGIPPRNLLLEGEQRFFDEWSHRASVGSRLIYWNRHADVERLMAEAIEAARRRDAIRAALDALPAWQRRALEARCAVEFLQRVAA